MLPKIKELCIIAKSTNAAIIGIGETKLNESVLEPDIENDDYKILRSDRKRHRGGAACYIRNDLSYDIISIFPSKIESVFFEILLPNSKPITVGTIYCPPNQSNFLEVQNENMNNIDSISNKTYILGVMSRIVTFFSWLSLQSDIIIASILFQQCNQKTFTIFFLKKDY